MKRYTVVWGQAATDCLAETWLASSNRSEVTSSVQAIDTPLAEAPFGPATQVLTEGLRVCAFGSLRFIFWVEEPDNLVEVVGVTLVPRSD